MKNMMNKMPMMSKMGAGNCQMDKSVDKEIDKMMKREMKPNMGKMKKPKMGKMK